MTKNRRQKKNEQQTCCLPDLPRSWPRFVQDLAANLPVPGWAAQRCFCFRQDY